MAAFVVYGRISQSGNRYVAVVTAVPENPDEGLGSFAAVRASSREAAEQELARLVEETRESLKNAGHEVKIRIGDEAPRRG